MTKSEYLKSKSVSDFVKWMSLHLDDQTFKHEYMKRRGAQLWKCSSLYDAFKKYSWRHPDIPRLSVAAGATFASNVAALAALKKDLVAAIGPVPSDAAALAASIEVMKWGGVGPGNVSWLSQNSDGLATLLQRTRDVLDGGNALDPLLTSSSLRFNAGMTKVYSLICKNFIIYDSRVAAALGLAVVRFCKDRRMNQVPTELAFPWAPAKEALKAKSPKRRNPGEGAFSFPSLRSGPAHAEWNLKAGWLLTAILKQSKGRSQFHGVGGPSDALRALEAALFMIGYDLPKGVGLVAGTDREAQPVVDRSPVQRVTDCDDWIEATTRAKGNEFHYKVTATGIATKDGPSFSDQEINDTLNGLWAHFQEQPFPLANSALGVPKGLAPMGLGVAFHEATKRNPPDTSRLAAVLEDYFVLEPHKPRHARGKHWTLNATKLDIKAAGGFVNIRRVFEGQLIDDDES